jgi:3-phosphoshikimate 1-carboxyvinyltransferase
MDARIEPSTVAGTATAPPSKSYTHRALLAAASGDGCVVRAPLVSADTRATARAVEAFGASVETQSAGDGTDEGGGGLPADAEAVAVEGFGGAPGVPADVVDCENSGTTLRLTTATAGLVDGATVLTGDASLRSRPQGPLLDAVEALGGNARSTRANGQAPLVVDGPIEGGRVAMPGDVSSQFVTALLFAGALTESGLEVTLTTPLKSAPYVAITREVLSAFGVATRETEDGFAVEGDQRYGRSSPYVVPGDFSSASYLLAAGAVAAPERLRVQNLHPGPQGDAAIVDVLTAMGAAVDWDREAGVVEVGQAPLSGTTVDVGDTPDLLPTVAVLGAIADGETRIENCEHVRYKETDRVAAMAAELDRLGAVVEQRRDTLVVRGGDADLVGTRVDGRGDHRIVMALSVAGLVAAGTTVVEGAEHVAVSFPEFFERLSGLGARVTLSE